MRPHRRQPARLRHPWDSPGKNTRVGCHFLLQCMKVKGESEVAQSYPTLSDPMDCSLPGSSVHGIFQARVLEWGAIAFSKICVYWALCSLDVRVHMCHSLCLSRSGCLKLGSPSHDPIPPAFWYLKSSISHFLPCQCSQSSGPCLSRSFELLLWNRSLTNNSTLCEQGTQEHLDSCTLDSGSQELTANHFTLLLLSLSFLLDLANCKAPLESWFSKLVGH